MTGTTENNQKFWSAMAPTYDRAVDDSIGASLRPAVLQRLAWEKSLGRVVEFGCGTGYFTQALAGLADSVVATDFSDAMLAVAADRLKVVPNVTLRNEDCMKPSFADASFDTAFMSLMLNLTDDPAEALVQVGRVLKSGGTLIIANLDSEHMDKNSLTCVSYRLKVNYDEAASRHITTGGCPLYESDLRSLLKSAGFSLVSFEVIVDVSDPTSMAVDFLKAINVQPSASATGVPRTIVELGSAPRVIEVKNLLHKYGSFVAVYGVSFNVRRGEVFALLGPNGAGKTTVVEILECLKTPTGGFVSILGDAVLISPDNEYGKNPFPGEKRDNRGIKEKIGVLPQSFGAFDLLTVRENLDYFARMYDHPADIDRLIAEFRLEDKRNARFRDLSGGLKQRVGIALALVNDPEIVFLDEPTAGLDPQARRDVWDMIKSLKARGKTVFLTTHYMDEAEHLADHVCIIHRGGIVAEGSPDELVGRYGGGSTLVVRECDAVAMERLLREIPESVADDGGITARLSPGDDMASLSRAIRVVAGSGGTCKEIYVAKSSLDDVFLNLTGEAAGAMAGR